MINGLLSLTLLQRIWLLDMANKDYDNMGPWSQQQEKFGKWIIKKIGKYQTAVYELTNGRLWNKFLGVHCAILTTTGKKTGLPRKTPLLYIEQGKDVVMVASQGGFSTEPFWYKNILNNPEVQVQIGSNKRTMIARLATDEEKEQLWPKLDALYEGYKEYRARTRGIRVIPIVIFSEK
jgi:deazaflavin-dependent oxidoreductase (nitroreductase family)